MRYGILGSTQVSDAPIGPRQVRTVLAVLLSRANQPVSTELLAGELWPGAAPPSSAAILQSRVSALRKRLCPELSARSPHQLVRPHHGGYTLVVHDGEVDADEFSRAVEAGRRAAARGDLVDASRQLRAGLCMWRGPALQDTMRGPHLTGYAGLLEQQRLAALEARFEVDIALGNLTDAISGLTEQLAHDPTQENIAALLVEALVAAGRGTAAREVVAATRLALDRVGMAPGARLHRALDRLRPEASPATTAAPIRIRPAQVPAQLADFTGRGDLLERLRAELTGHGARFVVLSGPGGIGKSTLAVRSAHLLRWEFPDGQVVADLAAEPGQPAEVLRRFLLAIGIAEETIPHDYVERQQLWRSHTADARLLVLLDDARSEAQVRALLPAGDGCGVLVTSRRRMLGLAGARTVPVDVFRDDEAADLLTHLVGADRVAAEPGPARRLLELSAGLPLAVRIVGAKLAARPHETIEELVTRIDAGTDRLTELRAGDLDVRATIDASYSGCSDETRQALRLLGAVRLPAISRTSLAVLLDTSKEVGCEVAEALVEAQLLQVRGRDGLGQVRYHLHDLIAAFAQERAREAPADAADAALRRLLDHYLAAATGSWPWCAAEADNVLAVVRAATHRRWWDRAWRLADAFAEISVVLPGLTATRGVTVLALWAARRGGDTRAQAISLRRLGDLYWQQARSRGSVRYLAAAARLFRQLGDDAELARTLVLEADVQVETGRIAEARERLSVALKAATRSKQAAVRAAVLDELGGLHCDSGEFAEAVRRFREALRLAGDAGDRRGTVAVRKRLADVLRRNGRHDHATTLLTDALAEAREIGDPHWEAHVLRSLGEVQRYTGDTAAALGSLSRSLALFTEHGHRYAAAYSLRSLADLRAQVHDYDQADADLERCRTIFEALGDRRGQAYTWRSIGGLRVRTGQLPQAERALRAALTLADDLSLRWLSQDIATALAKTRAWTKAG
jgi:DNA-binding SARP family transcriptional activator/tetratricopeptide (TPR) repeat protein